MKTSFDVEGANQSTRSQLRTLSLLALGMTVFFLLMIYLIASTQTFLTFLLIGILGNYGLWVLHKRVESSEGLRADAKSVLPAEELVLDPRGYHWFQKRLQPIQVDIAWQDVQRITFDPLNGFISYGGNRKLKLPRIVSENQLEIMEFIDQNLGLKRVEENKRWRDEEYTAVHYQR